MSHYVKCPECGKTFDRDKIDCIGPIRKRYFHKECYNNAIDVNYQNIILDLLKMSDKSRIEIQKHIDEKNEIWEGKAWLEEQYHNWMQEAERLKEELDKKNHKKKRFIK